MKIFIADDSPMICARLVTILADIEGVSIVGYSLNVIQAMPVIKAARPDVILIGSHFPRLNASNLIRFIKLESPGSTVIMLTDHPDDGMSRYSDAGANFGFDKATELDGLVETIVRMGGSVIKSTPVQQSAEERNIA